MCVKLTVPRMFKAKSKILYIVVVKLFNQATVSSSSYNFKIINDSIDAVRSLQLPLLILSKLVHKSKIVDIVVVKLSI